MTFLVSEVLPCARDISSKALFHNEKSLSSMKSGIKVSLKDKNHAHQVLSHELIMTLNLFIFETIAFCDLYNLSLNSLHVRHVSPNFITD